MRSVLQRMAGGATSLLQRCIIACIDASYRVRRNRLPRVGWVVGPNEVANMATQLARALPNSVTAVIVRHPFYDGHFDIAPPHQMGRFAAFKWRWLTLPSAFVRLANSATGFLYVSHNGYLLNLQDNREFEFAFLRRHGVKIACCLTGSDVRSPKLMHQHELATGTPNIATYLKQVDPVFGTEAYDLERKRTAAVIDKYADEIFTFRVDQAAYLERETKPFPYLVPDDAVREDLRKFDGVERLIVLHAPSSPIIKGTQLVRSAVEALRQEGLDFEYVELAGVPHKEVMRELARAHIVLNEFYAFVPGVFAVEAMAEGCVVLTSADERIEPDLPVGSNEAWIVTAHWQVSDNLRAALTHPESLRAQAEAGLRWVGQHAAASVSGARIREILNNAGAVTK